MPAAISCSEFNADVPGVSAAWRTEEPSRGMREGCYFGFLAFGSYCSLTLTSEWEWGMMIRNLMIFDSKFRKGG